MKRIDIILNSQLFKDELMKIETSEKERKFCCHGMTHLCDVARIAYIICLEEKIIYPKDVIYAAAILHDLGRSKQLKNGENHRSAGIKDITKILENAGFNKNEIKEITNAILNHGNCPIQGDRSLDAVLYYADKKSRNCFMCKADAECNWPDAQKNKTLEY